MPVSGPTSSRSSAGALCWPERSVLRRWAHDDAADLDVSRLLDCEGHRPRDRIRRDGVLLLAFLDRRTYAWVGDRISEAGVHETWGHLRHPKVRSRFLTQRLGCGPHRVLGGGVHPHRRHDLETGRREDVDDVAALLPTEDGQGEGA